MGELTSPAADDCVGDCEGGGASEQVQLAGDFTGLFAAIHIELAVDTLHLRFHGVDGNDQFLSDLRVGATGGEQAQHAPLLSTQRLEERHGGRG